MCENLCYNDNLSWDLVCEVFQSELLSLLDRGHDRKSTFFRDRVLQVAKTYDCANWRDTFRRLNSFTAANWGLKRVQEVNLERFQGFDINTYIDLHTTAILDYVLTRSTRFEDFVPSNVYDILAMWTGMLSTVGDIVTADDSSVLELGAGTGNMSLTAAVLGFSPIYAIEKHACLVSEAERNEGYLVVEGIIAGGVQITFVSGRYSPRKSQNRHIGDQAFDTRFWCIYHFPQEISRTLQMFRNYYDKTSTRYLAVLNGRGFISKDELRKYSLRFIVEEAQACTDGSSWSLLTYS